MASDPSSEPPSQKQGNEPSIVKATFEYSDGSKAWIDGPDVAAWEKMINNAMSMAYIHGFRFPNIKIHSDKVNENPE